jgi:hypothetical protein
MQNKLTKDYSMAMKEKFKKVNNRKDNSQAKVNFQKGKKQTET